jgi:hypothetical protein
MKTMYKEIKALVEGWQFNTVGPRLINAPVHEQIFQAKKSRMTNGFSDYEHASWQQRQAESISAQESVAG